MRFTTFDLHHLVATTVDRFSREAHEKGLQLAFRLADDLPRIVFGDVDELSDRLGRLVAHAIKATERGEVAVSVHHDLGNRFRFAVSDTSPGMTPEASLNFVSRTDPGIGMHTGPGLGSTVWFLARLDPAEATAGA